MFHRATRLTLGLLASGLMLAAASTQAQVIPAPLFKAKSSTTTCARRGPTSKSLRPSKRPIWNTCDACFWM